MTDTAKWWDTAVRDAFVIAARALDDDVHMSHRDGAEVSVYIVGDGWSRHVTFEEGSRRIYGTAINRDNKDKEWLDGGFGQWLDYLGLR